MTISELLIPELEHETQLTETFLKRVPADKLEWAPHEKSMPLGKLCAHLVEIYSWIPATMDLDTMDMASYHAPKAGSVDAVLDNLHTLAPLAATSLKKDDSLYWETWTMTQGEEVLMQMPRYTMLRSFVLSQFPHHRAQLGVYLRLLDVAVPASYGPSADEAVPAS